MMGSDGGVTAALHDASESMDRLATSNTFLGRNFARGRRQFRALMVTLVLLVAVLVVNIVAVANLLGVSHTIRSQTSPAHVAAEQQNLKNIEQLLIGCENNHVDRVVAFLTHKPIPVLDPGCPPDSMSR